MATVADSRRHLDRVLSELATAYGRVEVVREPCECDPEVRDAILDRFEAFGRVGGVGAWVENPDGDLLLVRTDDRWAEPSGAGFDAEDRAACARRAVRDATGLDPMVVGVSHVHVRYMTDWTDRDPVPNPFVVFEARADGEPEAGEGYEAAAWHATLPENLLYEGLRDLR